MARSTMKKAAKSKPPVTKRTVARKTQPSLTPERLLQLGLGFWGPRTLLSAVELGVFSELATGALQRTAGKYRNAPDADAFLDRAKAGCIGGLLEMAAARLYPFWGSQTEALRTGAKTMVQLTPAESMVIATK